MQELHILSGAKLFFEDPSGKPCCIQSTSTLCLELKIDMVAFAWLCDQQAFRAWVTHYSKHVQQTGHRQDVTAGAEFTDSEVLVNHVDVYKSSEGLLTMFFCFPLCVCVCLTIWFQDSWSSEHGN